MAYQDDFRNKVLEALKAKNLAVDISQEATQQAIVEEAQNVANAEARPMSPEEMKQVLQDVSRQLAVEQRQFSAQSADFTALYNFPEGGGPGGSYSGGGLALSTANKDIMIIPAAGGLGAAGLATSVNSLSQIDFKHIANPNAYSQFDPSEVKSSIYNWAERKSGQLFDTPVLGIGGAWGGVSYAPTSGWGVQTSGVGGSFGSGVGGSINFATGFGQIIYIKPASSTFYAALYNDLGINVDFASGSFSLTGYNAATPNSAPTAGFALTFGGIGGSGDLIVLGAALNTQTNTVKFSSPLTISNTTATDTLSLGLSSAASGFANTQWFVGGTGQTSNVYVLSAQAPSFSLGDMFYAAGVGHTTLARLATGANGTYLTSNGSVPSWTNTISANTVSVNPAIGSTILYPLLNNLAGAGSAVSTDVDFSVDPGANILRYSSGSFYVGTAVSTPTFTSVGSMAIKPGANATTAIQIQASTLAASGSTIVNIDTTNSRVSINSGITLPSYTLDVFGDTNISSGSVYRIAGNSVLSNNTLGTNVVTSSLTAVGTISTGTWSATAITTNYGGTGFQTYSVGDILYAGTASSLGRLPIGTVNQFLSTNGTIPQWVSGNGLTVGTSYQIFTAQTNVAPTLYPLFANSSTGSIGASIDLDIVYNAFGNILTVPNVYSGTAISSPTFTSSASLAIKPGANSTTGIQIQTATLAASGSTIVNIDTTNSRVAINSGINLPSYTLDVFGDTNISTGSVYRIAGTSVLSNNTLGTGVVTSSLTTVGIIGTGQWNGTAIGLTYGGTGSNLGPAASIGNSNRIIVTGNTGSYASSLIDNATSGNLLVSGGPNAAPTFTNSTTASFTFGGSSTLTINNASITTGTITGVPTSGTDIVNKSYADSLSGGLDPHASVRLTTISAIGGSYRQSGTAGTLAGFNDYIIATTPAELISVAVGLDTPASGIALTLNQRVLVKDGVLGNYASGSGAYGAYPTTYGGFAASYVANGIYTVASYGGAATSGWLLVRATDTDNNGGSQELTGGTFTFVEEGTTYADNAFVCTNDTTSFGPIGFGSTQITWSAFSGGAALLMGQGLTKSGNTIAANFNIANDGNLVSGVTYQGFAIGGARSGGVGSSSRTTFTVTAQGGANDVATSTLTLNTTGFKLSGGSTNRGITVGGASDQTLVALADGFNHQGGTSSRTLTVTGGDITLTGSGTTLSLSTTGTLSLFGNTLSIANGSNNITFQSASASGTTAATIQYIMQNGVAQYQLSTSTATFGVGDLYYGAGTAFTALSRLALGGTGASVLIRNSTNPVWGTINLASSDYVSGILGLSAGGTNANLTAANGGVVYSTSTALAITAAGTGGSILVSNGNAAPTWQVISLTNGNSISGTLGISNGGTNNSSLSVTAGQVVYTDGSKLMSTSAGSAGQALISNGASAPSFGTLSLAGGGTSNTIAGAAISYQFAQYNSTGTAISSFALPQANFSVLISATPTTPQWSAGPLGIAYGGTAATAANYTSNGIVIYDSTNTRLASATGATLIGGTGLSITGSVAASTGFFVGANSVVTSVTPSGGSAIYGSVGIAVSNTNPAGSLIISGSGQTVYINGPGTGITGTGAATQISYFNAARELTGDVGLVYSRTAATGIGLSINVTTATTGTILRVNSSSTFTAGLLLDVDNNSVQAFAVDFKGMATHAASSGNTALIMTGGRTILAASAANYASLNIPSGVNMSAAGSTQIGDLWFNGTNLYFRKDASTNFDLLVGSVSGSGLADRVAKWSSGSGLTYSNLSESTAGVGMTLTSLASIGAGGGTTALLTLQTISADNQLTDRYFVRGVTSGGARLFSIDTAGNLRATTKSFDIPHPTKEGLRLVYGVLEGPEHGVYHRGTVEGKGVIQVNLPDYWHKLVGDQYTIQLTPWGNYNVSIDSKTENYFTIQLVGDFISRKFKNIKVDYIVHGSRLDAPLDTEQ